MNHKDSMLGIKLDQNQNEVRIEKRILIREYCLRALAFHCETGNYGKINQFIKYTNALLALHLIGLIPRIAGAIGLNLAFH